MLCKNCGHVQLSDVVSPEIIYVNYIYETVTSFGLVKHFDKYASEIINKIHPQKNALVVDIGSNDGTLLRSFKFRGMRVLGIDPAQEIAKSASKSGIETLPEFFTPSLAKRIVKKYGQAEIVTANNLVANIDDLDVFMKGIKTLLSKNGVFIFESFYLLNVVDNLIFDHTYHEHLSYFTVKPLKLFFQNIGMKLINVLWVPTKDGSIRYYVQLKNGRRKISPSVSKQIEIENKAEIHKKKVFISFEKEINNAKNETISLLKKLRKQGKTIAGYGASASSTTLLYHFGLHAYLDYLIDENPRKDRTLSPGKHLPVYSQNILLQKKPDYILILAWRYAGQITKKNKEFVEGGGRFIIPLPKLKLLTSTDSV